jgi:hypothetical protein
MLLDIYDYSPEATTPMKANAIERMFNGDFRYWTLM